MFIHTIIYIGIDCIDKRHFFFSLACCQLVPLSLGHQNILLYIKILFFINKEKRKMTS